MLLLSIIIIELLMENPGGFNFQVGQLVEFKTFEHGFRGAWFRCKIKDIQLQKNKIWLEHYDYDSEELSWEDIYQIAPYMMRLNIATKVLMVRPSYPLMYRESKMPAVISQPCVIISGTWKVGDHVDWFEQGCYWSARVVKVLSDDKVQVELPLPPAGEGKEGEEGKYEASVSDLRPSLNWSETEGWTLAALGGHTCDAQLIFPTNQGEGMNLEAEREHEAAGSTARVSGEKDGENEHTEIRVEMDCALMESSESISSSQRTVVADKVKVDVVAGKEKLNTMREQSDKVKVEVAVEKENLNIMHERTLEAVGLDLEGLVNKVNWLQRLLKSPTNGNA
ncbi:uncharacterized protein LOC143600276 [Bidens hawaiensis]|uniref:uncharacterized protein LOC143600276 n=1 Tax=Bidens hawaiensis TaxID=980011 RepID=UPI00404BA3BF